jgi:AraC-like DNA-binding protein
MAASIGNRRSGANHPRRTPGAREALTTIGVQAEEVSVRQRVMCDAASVELGAVRPDAHTRNSTQFACNTMMFMTGGCVRTSGRQMNSVSAPRGPSRAGEFNFFPAGTLLSSTVEGEELRYVIIEIGSEYFDKVTKQVCGQSFKEPIIGRFDPLCTAVGRQIETEMRTHGPDQLLIECAVSLAMVRTMRSTPSDAVRGAEVIRLSSQEFARVLDQIESKLHREISLADLAGQLDMSVHYFAKAFKNCTGQAPYQFVLQRRLDRACTLLRDSSMTIVDVALSVGFNSQSHFTTHFRRALGTTPARYRASVSC